MADFVLLLFQVDAWSPLMPSPVFVRRYYAAKYAANQRIGGAGGGTGFRFSRDTWDTSKCAPCSSPDWEPSRQVGGRTTLNSYAFPEVQQRLAEMDFDVARRRWMGQIQRAEARAQASITICVYPAVHTYMLTRGAGAGVRGACARAR